MSALERELSQLETAETEEKHFREQLLALSEECDNKGEGVGAQENGAAILVFLFRHALN